MAAAEPHRVGRGRQNLGGRPVRARPDSWRYVSGKFVRRHAVALSAASRIVALVIGANIA